MKSKFIALFLILCISLSACGGSDEFAIENHSWEFSVALNRENGAQVCCADSSKYPNTRVIDLHCEIRPDAIVLTTDSESWELDYKTENIGVHSSLYRLGEDEFAAVTLTEFDDGTSVYTLVISCGGYSLYFYET